MAIYAGIEGITRKLDYMDTGRYGSIYHIPSMKAGIDGVARDLMSFVETVERLEIRAEYIAVSTIDYEGNYVSDDGRTLEVLNKYGSVSISSNQVQVSCTTRYKQLNVYGYAYIVFKDGHEEQMRNGSGIFSDANNTFNLNVTDYEYFNDDGWYYNLSFGTALYSTHVTNSHTGTTNISKINSNICFDIMSSLRDSGTARTRQTFNSFKINGVTIPVTVVNKLT